MEYQDYLFLAFTATIIAIVFIVVSIFPLLPLTFSIGVIALIASSILWGKTLKKLREDYYE